VVIECNTSAEQQFLARWTRRDSVDPLNEIDWTDPRAFPGPLNITSVVLLWVLVQSDLWETIAPSDNKSVFYPSLFKYGLSSVQLSYSGTSFHKARSSSQKLIAKAGQIPLQMIIGNYSFSPDPSMT